MSEYTITIRETENNCIKVTVPRIKVCNESSNAELATFIAGFIAASLEIDVRENVDDFRRRALGKAEIVRVLFDSDKPKS